MIKYASLLFFAVLFSSCVSDRAFIEKTDGTVIEARITDGNYKTLYASKDNSELIQIDRAEIADIDHPGNVAIVFGSLLTLAGVGTLYSTRDTGGGERRFHSLRWRDVHLGADLVRKRTLRLDGLDG